MAGWSSVTGSFRDLYINSVDSAGRPLPPIPRQRCARDPALHGRSRPEAVGVLDQGGRMSNPDTHVPEMSPETPGGPVDDGALIAGSSLARHRGAIEDLLHS